MTRDFKDRLDELEEAGVGEWSDVEEWRAFITGRNPRTGEPLSDERREKYLRAWGAFDKNGDASEDSP